MADQKLQIKISGDSSGFEAAAARSEKALSGMGGAASAFAAGISAMGLTVLARDLLDAGVAADKMKNSMAAATGSIVQGAAEMQFVRAESLRLGLDLQSTADAYTKLAAASKGTSLEGDKSRQVFSAVAEASTTLGLSAEQTAGALTAIQQMISKGNVSAEELRGQLGERIPGAFNIAARAIGVTTMELDAMLKKGEVVSADFLPKFAAEMTRTFGATESSVHSAQAELNRFKTSIFEIKVLLMEQGGNDSLKTMATAATSIATAFRSVILEVKETKIHWMDMLKTAGIMMNGGPLGMNWLTKSGRAEIKAELDAQEKMYEWQLMKLSEMRTIKAVSAAATPIGGGGGSAAAAAGGRGAGSKTAASFFGAAWDAAASGAEFDSLQGTQFNTDMSTSFGQGGAGRFSILGPGGAEAWLAQAEIDRETKLQFEMDNMSLTYQLVRDEMAEKARIVQEGENRINQIRSQANGQYLDAFSSIMGTVASVAGDKYKILYLITQGAAIATTFLSGQAAAAAALAPPPLGLGPVAGAPLAAAIEGDTYRRMALMAAVSITNVVASAAKGGTNPAYGSGTPLSPIVTQPGASATPPPGDTVIVLKGLPLGKWVEEELVPEISRAGQRNIRIEYAEA